MSEKNMSEAPVIDIQAIVNEEEPKVFHGRVVTTHDTYCFIADVKQGYSTVATNGDVFCPRPFPVDSIVQFSNLRSDGARSGRFCTDTAVVVQTQMVIPGSKEDKIARIQDLAFRRALYHANAKKIDPAQVQKATENIPFQGYAENLEQVENFDMQLGVENFLLKTFLSLESHGVTFSINPEKIDEEAEKKSIESSEKAFTEAGMQGQAASLKEEYKVFKGVRRIFTVLNQNKLLSISTVLPRKFLVDLMVACPVWFLQSKSHGVSDNPLNSNTPVDASTRLICELLPTRDARWFYQMYNHPSRQFSRFDGREVMPAQALSIAREALGIFDAIAIMTPYLDLASNRWNASAWARNIDPYLVGISKHLPFIFPLYRWSGTGLFPLVCDMIADTMDHLKINMQRLANIPPQLPWYEGAATSTGSHPRLETFRRAADSQNTVLPKFAESLLKRFEDGTLLSHLRGDEVEQKEMQEI